MSPEPIPDSAPDPLNSRQRRFVTLWAAGYTPTAAARDAGYKHHEVYAIRLKRHPAILRAYEVEAALQPWDQSRRGHLVALAVLRNEARAVDAPARIASAISAEIARGERLYQAEAQAPVGLDARAPEGWGDRLLDGTPFAAGQGVPENAGGGERQRGSTKPPQIQ